MSLSSSNTNEDENDDDDDAVRVAVVVVVVVVGCVPSTGMDVAVVVDATAASSRGDTTQDAEDGAILFWGIPNS